MGRRSRKHKKRFSCGHRGYGQYCHCCADRQQRKQAKNKLKQQRRQQWQALFEQDVIDLTGLPKGIVLKARRVLASLAQGSAYWLLGGKRLNAVREGVKIPIGYRYRLLCRLDDQGLTPLKVLSHEEYNPLSRNPKRRLAQWLAKGFSRGGA